jgi:hypothetical protein
MVYFKSTKRKRGNAHLFRLYNIYFGDDGPWQQKSKDLFCIMFDIPYICPHIDEK